MTWATDKLTAGVTNADYLLDYSAAKISGKAIKDAGYSGSIRYIDSPGSMGRKHTSKAEYDDHIANDLIVRLVMEVSTTDADGGFNRGVEYAKRAKAGADYLGYEAEIFFCNDRTTLTSISIWQQYLDGAASVLGPHRIGAYGFKSAVDSAVGHAAFFWQAGRKTDVSNHVNYWQDNNAQVTVGGVICDRNLVKEFDMAGGLTEDEHRMLANLDRWLSADLSKDLDGDLQVTFVNGKAGDEGTYPNAVSVRLKDLQDKLGALAVGGVDIDALADKVADKLLAKINLKQAQ